MSILDLRRKKPKFGILNLVLGLFIFGGAYLIISFYSGISFMKHDIVQKEKEMRSLEVLSAELKNELYSILDSENLNKASDNLGLVLDKHPHYIESDTQELLSKL